jgi:hypothetical protein
MKKSISMCLTGESFSKYLFWYSKIKYSQGRGKKKREKYFWFPTQEMGTKTQNGGLQLLVL